MSSYSLALEACDIIRQAAPHMLAAVRRALPGAGAGVILDQHRDDLEAELVAMVLRLVEDLARRKITVLVCDDADLEISIT